MENVTGDRPPRAIPSAEPTHESEIGPVKAGYCLAQRLADEGHSTGPTVTDRWFGDGHHDGKKAILLIEESAHIEPAIFVGKKK
jgi:hypothetical protein